MFFVNSPIAITDIASCVAIADGEDGLWYDVACGEQHEAICEKLSTTVTQGPTQAPSQPSGSCDPTWIAYDNYCYLVYIFTLFNPQPFPDSEGYHVVNQCVLAYICLYITTSNRF